VTTTSPQVRRVQELRRSNAAQPIPGKRQDGPSADEWDDADPIPTGGPGRGNGWISRPGRELPKVWREIARMLVDQQGWTYRYKRKGGSHPRVIPPDGGLGVALPTTVTDGDAGHRASYLTALKRAGAVLDAAPERRGKALGSVGSDDDDAPMTINGTVESPWTEREWREMQRESGVWWREQYAPPLPEPEPEPEPEPAPAPTPSAYAAELLRRLDSAGHRVRDDAQGNGRYTLAEARQQLRDGYSLERVIERTGWGRLWLQDLAERLGA
jgi:hypothetical protein